jgi:hypothetical protein
MRGRCGPPRVPPAGCYLCLYQTPAGALAGLLPLEWITGWRRHPGETGIYFCHACFPEMAGEFRAMGFPSGLAVMAELTYQPGSRPSDSSTAAR